jgi:hypothetical protein
MKKTTIHDRYDLSAAFVAAVKQTNAVLPIMMRIDPVWRQADRILKGNQEVATRVHEAFRVKPSTSRLPSPVDTIDGLAFSIRCKNVYPCCDALIAFDHLQAAYALLPRPEQLALDVVMLALAGSRLQTFIESTPCSPAPLEDPSEHAQGGDVALINCPHTGLALSPEIYHKRFWVHCDTIDWVSGELDGTPDMDCKTDILGSFSALDDALGFLITAANNDTAHKSCSYSLRYLHFTLLQGWITQSTLKWHKPGVEVDDVSDYFDERSGFNPEELCRLLMDTERARGYGSRAAEEFLLVDLGM